MLALEAWNISSDPRLGSPGAVRVPNQVRQESLNQVPPIQVKPAPWGTIQMLFE